MIAGLILAAGDSSRMGSPKALLRLQGATFLDRLIHLFGFSCGSVTVVLSESGRAIPEKILFASDAKWVYNPAPEQGMLSSYQCGLRSVVESAEAIVFTPVDYPAVRPETVRLLIETWTKTKCPIVRPRYQGQHGHPVCISRDVANAILALPVTAKASDVIHEYAGRTAYVDVKDAGICADVDDPEAYRNLVEAFPA